MIPYMWAAQDKTFITTPAVMVNGNTIMTVSGGPIMIDELIAICVTANDGTASTLQFSSTPTVGSATVFSAASASLASATAGTIVRLNPTSLATAPTIITAANGGVAIGAAVANRIIIKEGIITMVIATGSTTGTWKHAIRYRPLTPDSIILG